MQGVGSRLSPLSKARSRQVIPPSQTLGCTRMFDGHIPPKSNWIESMDYGIPPRFSKSETIHSYIHATFLNDYFDAAQKLRQESHFFLSVSHKVCHQYNKDLFIALVEEVSGGVVVKPYKTSKKWPLFPLKKVSKVK